jgi:DNA-binding MarR family transcriptional regulator
MAGDPNALKAIPDSARPLARQLLRAVRGLVRRFQVSERADVVCCGVTIAQAATLEALREEGRMRLGTLGKRLGISPSTLSRNLDRLEESGHVTRILDPDDARAAQVALTAAGHRIADRLESQEEDFAGEILGRIPKDRRARVVEALTDLLAAIRSATEDCCPEAFTHLMKDFPDDAGRSFSCARPVKAGACSGEKA